MAKARDAFRTISEVSETLDTPAHVLRFWESKFTQVKPVKRAGGRRYYRPEDVALLGGIKSLLHDQGMTIKAVQKLLRSEGVKHVAALSTPIDPEPVEDAIEHRPAAAASESPGAAPLDNVVPLQTKPRDPPLPDPAPDTPKPPPEPTPPPEPGPPPVAEDEHQVGFDWGDAVEEDRDEPAPVETDATEQPAVGEEPDPATEEVAPEHAADAPQDALPIGTPPPWHESASPAEAPPADEADDESETLEDDIAARVASRIAEAQPAEVPSPPDPSPTDALPPEPEVAPTLRMAMPPPTPIVDAPAAPASAPQIVRALPTEADLPSLVPDDPPSPGPRLFDALAAADPDAIRRQSGRIAPYLDQLDAVLERMRRPT